MKSLFQHIIKPVAFVIVCMAGHIGSISQTSIPHHRDNNNLIALSSQELDQAEVLLREQVESSEIFKLFPIIDSRTFFSLCKENDYQRVGITRRRSAFETTICPNNTVNEFCINTSYNFSKIYAIEILEKLDISNIVPNKKISMKSGRWSNSDLVAMVGSIRKTIKNPDWIIIPANRISGVKPDPSGVWKWKTISGVDIWLMDVNSSDITSGPSLNSSIYSGIYPNKYGWFFVSEGPIISNIEKSNPDRFTIESTYGIDYIRSNNNEVSYAVFKVSNK